MSLRIASDLELPDEAVVQTFALLAKRGAGKTYFAAVMAEEMIGAGHAVVILDVVGVFWGLLSSADGKSAGLSVVIVGGDHGHLPLESAAGALMADTVIETRQPIILDLSHFSKTEQRRFVTDFAERLYQKNRDPLHLIIDEADAFVPQRIIGGDERMFGAIDTIVRRGRARGLGVTLISQRPAVLHKDVLTQIEVMIALRLVGPHDREAIGTWVNVHAEDRDKAKEMLGSLPSLPIGEAWIWSPGWLDLWKRFKVRKRSTFDSSATPKPGAKVSAPTKVAAVDLDALRVKMAAVVEAKAKDDPKALRARVAELEAQLASRDPAPAERIEVPILTNQEHELLDGLRDELSACEDTLAATKDRLENLASAVGQRAPAPPALTARAIENEPIQADRAPRASARQATAPTANTANADLPRAERALLQAMAQLRAATAVQVSIISGYSVTSSSFQNALGALRTAGLVEGSRDSLRITEIGRFKAGKVPPMPAGIELMRFWCDKLPKAEAMLLACVVGAGRPISKADLSKSSGYSITSSSFQNAIGKLRTLELVRRGEPIAAAEAFGGAR